MDAVNKRDIVSELKSELLDMANSVMDSSFFVKASIKIHEILNSTECSLWSINRNITEELESADEKTPMSTSLLFRAVEKNDYDPLSRRDDFAHDLQRGFFKIVMGDSHEDYYRCDRDEVEKYGHRSMDFVRTYELNDFIVIPISDKNEKEKIVAVLELSYKTGANTISKDEWEEIAQMTKSFFSSAFNRYLIFQEQGLMERLISTQEKNRDNGINTFFDCLIDNEFRSFFDYQASSVFIWDSYHARYNLVSTTDKSIDVNDSKYSYEKGVGSTTELPYSYIPYHHKRKEYAYQGVYVPASNSSLTVGSGAELTIEAGSEIILQPGFTAEYGSEVNIKINPNWQSQMAISVPYWPNAIRVGVDDGYCIETKNADSWEFTLINNGGAIVFQSAGSIISDRTCLWDGQGVPQGNYYGIVALKNSFGRRLENNLNILVLPSSLQNTPPDNTTDVEEQSNTLITAENFDSRDDVTIYPNPSSGVFSIEIKDDAIIDISVTNSLGEYVYVDENIEKSKYILNLTGYAKGVYYIAIQGIHKQYKKKIIIN